jgi:hypothetical protein
MRAEYGDAVRKALDDAPQAVRKAFFKQLKFLEGDLRHPSLRAKSTTNRGASGRPALMITGVSILGSSTILITSSC